MSPAFFPDIPALFPIFPPDITARHPGRWRKKAPGIPFLNIFYLYVANHLCAPAIARPPKGEKGRFSRKRRPGQEKKTRLSRAGRSPPVSAMRAEAQGSFFPPAGTSFPGIARSSTKKARVFRRFCPLRRKVQPPGGPSCPRHGAPRRPFPKK